MPFYNEDSYHGMPSNHPLKSPSPDLKSKNSFGPTLSPHNTNIRKSFTQFTPPHKQKRPSYLEYSTLPNNYQSHTQNVIEKIFQNTHKNLNSINQNSQNQIKGRYSVERSKNQQIRQQQQDKIDLQSTGKKLNYEETSNEKSNFMDRKNFQRQLLKTIEEKDLIIFELKGMINLMTENRKHLKNSQKSIEEEEFQNMKHSVKILTIENQKLSKVIEKLSSKENQNNLQITPSKKQKNIKKQQLEHKLIESQRQIEFLKQALSQKQLAYQKEIDELIKSHKSLAIQCKMYENEKERFSKENERLINLLRLKEKEKETCYANYSYFDKNQFEPPIQQSKPNPEPIKTTIEQQTSNNRLSIQKIKAQYEENLKQYKQNVYNQVYSMFDTVNNTLQEMNEKIITLNSRITKMEKLKKLLQQRTGSHTMSVNENEEEFKKSAIYIQQAPSSERLDSQSQKSRQALSVILEDSRGDNQKMELELSELRNEVSEYKEKLSSRQRNQQVMYQNQKWGESEIQSYRRRVRELEGLVDELRQERQNKEKQFIQLQHQLFRTNQQSFKQRQTQITNSHSSDTTKQISALKEKNRKTEFQENIRSVVSQMEKAQQIRQKQLLDEIQRFQSSIKQTEETFKINKSQNENEKHKLNEQIQALKDELATLHQKNTVFERETQALKHENALLQSENNQRVQQVFSLNQEKMEISSKLQNWESQKIKLLSYVQRVKRVQKNILSYKQTLQNQDLFELIKSAFAEIQEQNMRLSSQNSQFLKIVQKQKNQIFNLNENKIVLSEKVNALEETIKIYKVELDQKKTLYDTLINQKNIGPNQNLQAQDIATCHQKKGKIRAKDKIGDLLSEQKKRISILIDSINQISSKPQKEEFSF